MAKPIKDTPTLTGKDAKVFSDQIKKVENNRPSEAELNRMRESYNKFEAITKKHNALPA